MTPADIAKSGTESGQQRALFAAVNREYWQYCCEFEVWPGERVKWDGVFRPWAAPLKWFHSIPNGGSRGDDARSRAIRGATMKAEGVKEGIPDTFMPCPRGRFAGLYIEMKKPGVKRASKEQEDFRDYALSVGYDWHLCNDWEQAFSVLVAYLKS